MAIFAGERDVTWLFFFFLRRLLAMTVVSIPGPTPGERGPESNETQAQNENKQPIHPHTHTHAHHPARRSRVDLLAMAFETFFDRLFLIVKRKGRNEVVDQRDWSDFSIVEEKKTSVGQHWFPQWALQVGNRFVWRPTCNRSTVRSGPRLNLFSKFKFRSRFSKWLDTHNRGVVESRW